MPWLYIYEGIEWKKKKNDHRSFGKGLFIIMVLSLLNYISRFELLITDDVEENYYTFFSKFKSEKIIVTESAIRLSGRGRVKHSFFSIFICSFTFSNACITSLFFLFSPYAISVSTKLWGK